VPEAAPVLLPLFELAGFLVAAGIVYVLYRFTRAVGGGISIAGVHVPGLGEIFGGSVNKVFQWMSDEFAAAYSGLMGKADQSFHRLARIVEWVGREIRGNATALQILAQVLLGSTLGGALKSLIDRLERRTHAIQAQVHSLNRQIGRTATKASQAAALNDARAQRAKVAANTKAIDDIRGHTVPAAVPGAVPVPGIHTGELPNLRAKVKELTDGLTNAWKQIRAHSHLLGVGALTTAVAIALGRLDASWTRCRNWKRIGREVCAANPNDITGLLSLFAAGAVLADYRELVKLAQQVEHGVAEGLQEIAKLSGR